MNKLERSEENLETPIFQAHGSLDPMVRPEAGQLAHDRLQALGYKVDFRAYRMAHQVCAEEIADIGVALRSIFGFADPE